MQKDTNPEVQTLEAEAQSHEAQAHRFSELAAFVNAAEHRNKLKQLAQRAREKAADIPAKTSSKRTKTSFPSRHILPPTRGPQVDTTSKKKPSAN
jgi:hypothetical protein